MFSKTIEIALSFQPRFVFLRIASGFHILASELPRSYGGLALLIEGGKRRMKKREVTIPQIGLMVGTRAVLGAGIAPLVSEKLTGEQRRAIGWTLVAVGALTTIPLVVQLLGAGE